MVGTVAAAPLARMIWLALTRPDAISALTSSEAPVITSIAVAMLWAGALLLGRDRGPALRPPVLTHVLASSPLGRAESFRGPVLRAGAVVTSVCALAAGLIGFSLRYSSLVSLESVWVFTGVGALVGVISAVAWLAGQAFPRTATALASVLVALGVLGAFVPEVLSVTPWGWAGAAYPITGGASRVGQLESLGLSGGLGLFESPSQLASLVALAALTCALVSAMPSMLNRLRQAELFTQAVHWELAVLRTGIMEFESAAGTYRRPPRRGRSIRAVWPGLPVPLRFLVLDAVGAARRPARLLSGLAALATAGALIFFTLSADGGAGVSLLAAAAGVIAYLGLGPLTDGLRYAASAAADYPLFGISDERLLAGHTLLPLLVALAMLTLATCVAAFALSGASFTATWPHALAAILTLGISVVVSRIAVSLKGPMPASLLTPIPSPAGDLSVIMQLVWALDGVLLAAAAGAAALLVTQLPVLPLGVTAVGAYLTLRHWRHR